jgi:aminopeptidase-like protein
MQHGVRPGASSIMDGRGTGQAAETSSASALWALMAALYPIPRSLTGDAVRRTFDLIAQQIPLRVHEIPSGTPVFDWEVPPEWNLEEAHLTAPDGRRLADVSAHALHVVGYSEPLQRRVSREALLPHLHSLPEQPDWIPYRTRYYRRDWGFCLRHRDLATLAAGEYAVLIRGRLAPGSLSYAECELPGRSPDEVLFFTHACHPQMANDNASGLAVATRLAQWLGSAPRRFTYRVVFAPGTIGSLCWLQQNSARLGRLRHGLTLGLLGDAAPLSYKRSRRGDRDIDRIVPYALRALDADMRVLDFEPYGYDERQFCSPGFDLPVGRLTRSVNGGYAQYHSSADDLALVTPAALEKSLEACKAIVEVIEADRRYVNLSPQGEPCLGKRGLYGAVGGHAPGEREHAMLWLLNQSDGTRGLLDIAERSRIALPVLREAAQALEAAALLRAESITEPSGASGCAEGAADSGTGATP